MSRGRKIALIVVGSLAGLVLVVFIGGIIVVQTDWFRGFVRDKIVQSVEESTGGRTEIGAFTFDWKHLRARVRDFVVHGTEPAGAAPLFRARLLQVDLKLLTGVKTPVDIAALLVDTPQANLIVNPDGTTNVPAPKVRKQSDTSGLETVVDLAVNHFDLTNGSVTVADRSMPLDAHGENLRALLNYNTMRPGYQGELSMSPLHLRQGANAPVDIAVKLPVTLERDSIRLSDARISTPESQITISGTVNNMKDPHTNARVSARVALDEVRRVAGVKSLNTSGNLPRVLTADAAFYADANRINVSDARVSVGRSEIHASGQLKDVNRPAGLNFQASLAMGELGRMLGTKAPESMAQARGTVRQQPNRLELAGMELSAFGGTFAGNAALDNGRQYRVNGRLEHFDIQQAASMFSRQRLPYDGVVSGPVEASGDTKDSRSTVARADLTIAPGRRGIPVTGSVKANYTGTAGEIDLGRSWVALPHSRVDLSGTLGRRLDVRFVSRDLRDLAPGKPLPVVLRGGAATFNGTVTGQLSASHAAGHLEVTNFAAADRQFDLAAADIDVTPSSASVRNGTLNRGTLDARFSATVGLHNFSPEPRQPLSANLTMRNADVRDVLALAGQSNVPANGNLTATARINGTVGDPRGDLALDVTNGSAWQQPIDRLEARAFLTDRAVTVPTLFVTSGPARVDADLAYNHAPGDLKRGNFTAHLASNNVQLAQFQSLVKDQPGLAGTASLNADAAGTVRPKGGETQVQLTSVNANAAVRGARLKARNLGDLTAVAHTSGGAVVYDVNSNLSGSTIRVNGQTMLAGDHATNATANIANFPVDALLDLAGRHDIQATGTLAANARVWGTTADPHAEGNMSLVRGRYQQQPIDNLQAAFDYSNRTVDLRSLTLAAGPARLEASASLNHPVDNFQSGALRFRVDTNRFRLEQLPIVQQAQAGLGGAVQLNADGAATLRPGGAPLFSTLQANLAAAGLNVDSKPLGDINATARTAGGDLVFDLNSNVGRADIRGTGRMRLSGDYPVNGQLTFARVTYAGLQPLLGETARLDFDAGADGRATFDGPAARPDDMKAQLEISRLDLHSAVPQNVRQVRRNIDIRNAGPIVVALDRSVVRIASAHLTGPYTDINVTGTAGLRGNQPLDLRAAGKLQLEAAEAFDANIFASGTVALNAAVQGSMSSPSVNGRLDLQNASFNMADLPNGITNGNGSVLFTGKQAAIQNITGETGGGKITLSGFVGYGGPEMRFQVEAGAQHVRVEQPPNVSTTMDAKLALAGTTTRSLLSGNVTILDVAFHSHSDVGSILSQAATPPSTPSAKSPVLSGMRLDVRIETAPEIQFKTTLAQNIDAEAQLRLRGTAAQPGMLGRVNITGGEAVFFGAKYSIDQGSITFTNARRINPLVNIDLVTNVKGIDVQLSVSGPMDRLKLSYRSDPPMQFSELVSLLATGKIPTTDPVLAAREPAAPQQSFQQLGASAVLGQAVANPVSGRLQRLFGITRLKIDPQIIGASNTPQARLTLEQQITRDLTFTYIQDVTQSNPQVMRVEWAFDPSWSAIMERDENGETGLDFFFKKRFR